MVRYATRLLADANRTARDRRRAVERLTCVVDDSRRPMTYLAILMGHLEREGKRLPGPLQEALAGGSEMLKHLEHALVAAAHAVSEQRAERSHAAPYDVDEGVRACFSALRRDATVARARLRLARLPTVLADPDGLSALLFAALGALLRATRRRERRVATVRVSARQRSHGLRIRFARFDAARRGSGVEELLLARRIALRLGIDFAIVASRRGGRAVVLDLPPEMQVVEPSKRRRRPESRASLT
jgi:light-regulated signal transduction histidine kinase (bacteriophytochrome)